MSELLSFILDHEEAFKRGRLASLYSDFRIQQATNPDGYNANVSAWRKALVDASRAGLIPSKTGRHNLLSFGTGEQLSRELTTKDYGRPLALAAVVQDAVAKKEMIPLKDFLAAKTSIYARSWSISPWGVLSWGLQQLGVIGSGSHDNLIAGEFVIVPNVEAAANAILARTSSPKSNIDLIYPLDAFSAAFAKILNPNHPLTPTDISILLTHLSRDKHALSYDPASQTIKLKPASAAAPIPVTEQDVTIAHLRSLIASLTEQIQVLSAKVMSLDAAARSAVAAKSTTAARAALRSKKLAEASLERRTNTLGQLEQVYSKIEEAADQVEVVRAMEASAGVLRNLHEEVGGAEGVEGVVERLREEMGKVDEVTDLVNEVGREGAVDEMEIDEEFEALEREEREKTEAAEAEKTRERLHEVEALEAERRARELERERQAAKEQQAEAAGSDEKEVDESTQELQRMSLDETRPTEFSSQEQQQPLPAE